jgi:hypothetical protein
VRACIHHRRRRSQAPPPRMSSASHIFDFWCGFTDTLCSACASRSGARRITYTVPIRPDAPRLHRRSNSARLHQAAQEHRWHSSSRSTIQIGNSQPRISSNNPEVDQRFSLDSACYLLNFALLEECSYSSGPSR